MIAFPRNVFVSVTTQPDNAAGGHRPDTTQRSRHQDLRRIQKRCQRTHPDRWPQLYLTKEHP